MAVDESLLRSAAESDRMTLRFYQWCEPTLSLGYFQRYEDRKKHPHSTNCPVVRRGTGGGAIIHDRELTYSLVVPARLGIHLAASKWYDMVHGAVIRAFDSLGIQSYTCPETVRERETEFLCFQRRAGQGWPA